MKWHHEHGPGEKGRHSDAVTGLDQLVIQKWENRGNRQPDPPVIENERDHAVSEDGHPERKVAAIHCADLDLEESLGKALSLPDAAL
jgi:hypothetical protein